MDRVGQSRNVDHTVSSGRIADSDLVYAGTNRWHRFLIARVETFLDLIQLMAGLAASIFGEVAQSIERISVESHRLECHWRIISLLI
jgi:hypothetical protein